MLEIQTHLTIILTSKAIYKRTYGCWFPPVSLRSRIDTKSISSSTGSLLTADAAADVSGSVRGRGRRRYSPAAALTRLR